MKRGGISKAGEGKEKKIRTEIKKRDNQLHLKQSKRDGFCSKMTRLPLRITRIFCQAGYPSESYCLPWSCKNQSTKNRARILRSRVPCVNKTQNRKHFLVPSHSINQIKNPNRPSVCSTPPSIIRQDHLAHVSIHKKLSFPISLLQQRSKQISSQIQIYLSELPAHAINTSN